MGGGVEHGDGLEKIVAEGLSKVATGDTKIPEAEKTREDREKEDKTKSTEAPVEAQVLLALPEESIQELLKSTFGILSKRMGEHWQLTEIEAKQEAKCIKLVLEKYNFKPTPEMTLLLWTAIIVVPRVMQGTGEKKKQEVKTDGIDKENTGNVQ